MKKLRTAALALIFLNANAFAKNPVECSALKNDMLEAGKDLREFREHWLNMDEGVYNQVDKVRTNLSMSVNQRIYCAIGASGRAYYSADRIDDIKKGVIDWNEKFRQINSTLVKRAESCDLRGSLTREQLAKVVRTSTELADSRTELARNSFNGFSSIIRGFGDNLLGCEGGYLFISYDYVHSFDSILSQHAEVQSTISLSLARNLYEDMVNTYLK